MSNRVFMSQTGDDANDCSNPLTPFAAAATLSSRIAGDGGVDCLQALDGSFVTTDTF